MENNKNTTVCSHLNSILESLISNGAKIEAIDSGWSEANLVVVLDKGLNPNVAKTIAKEHGLLFWKNNDPHYSIEYGLFCEKHKHDLSWPQGKSTIESI